MVIWAFFFLMLAALAGHLGFAAAAGTAAWIAKLLCVTFVVLVLISVMADRRVRTQ
jgi:uncharacterized membrane protein YtjA (UPF0391 family)